jgi:hypothetical protein
MAFVAIVISLLVAALGLLGIISPPRLLGVVRHIQTPAGLYTVAVIRLIFGAILFLVAPTSRAPDVVRIIGIIAFVAGLITPFFGLERFRRLLNWWSARGPAFIRVWGGFALAFGLWLAYAVFP